MDLPGANGWGELDFNQPGATQEPTATVVFEEESHIRGLAQMLDILGEVPDRPGESKAEDVKQLGGKALRAVREQTLLTLNPDEVQIAFGAILASVAAEEDTGAEPDGNLEKIHDEILGVLSLALSNVEY